MIHLKRNPYIVVNECGFEIGSISFMRAGEMKIVQLDLYVTPCIDITKPLFQTNLTGLLVNFKSVYIVQKRPPFCSILSDRGVH